MAKSNAKKTKEVVSKPAVEISETANTGQTVESQATQVVEEVQSEDIQKELQDQQKQDSGKQEPDQENTKVDIELENKENGETGGDSDIQVNDEEPEIVESPDSIKRQKIADDVFYKNSQTKVLYFTSDLIPFFVKSDALRHAAGKLKDDTITTIYKQ